MTLLTVFAARALPRQAFVDEVAECARYFMEQQIEHIDRNLEFVSPSPSHACTHLAVRTTMVLGTSVCVRAALFSVCGRRSCV